MNRKFGFTKSIIESLPIPEPGKRVSYYDTKVPGLELRVTGNGAKSFALCRKIKGRVERVTIGRFPAVTVETARQRAGELNSQIAMNRNPAHEKRSEKAESSLREVFDTFMVIQAKPRKRSWKFDEFLFTKYLDGFKDTRLSEIRKRDVYAWQSRIAQEHGGTTANRVLSLLSVLFSFAHKHMGYEGVNPCADVERFPEEKRSRFIQEHELPRFFEAVFSEPNTTVRDFLLLSLFTGQRRSNVLAMFWDEINWSREDWTIPAANFKSKRDHVVPLIKPAMDILRERYESSKSPWVFPSPASKTGHTVEPTKDWNTLLERAGIENFRIHDLRRTLASYMAVTGTPELIISAMLGHAAATVTGIYARLNVAPVRDAMETAVRYMLKHSTLDQESKIIPFTG